MENHKQYFHNEVYACFEQTETPSILPYLSLAYSDNSSSLVFNSDIEEGQKKNKRQKVYQFQKIYNKTQKFKYCFCENIKSIIESLLKGQNQGLLVYGTEQKSKDKILYGQSQNPGLLLLLIAQLFQQCHQKQIQESITIKLSCNTFNNGKFYDVYGGKSQLITNIDEDVLEGQLLVNIPEVIIRNVKTGLKLINIIMKMIKESREETFTENMIFTIKLQIDKEKREDQTDVYCLSKLHLIKLANPSVNSSLKGVNKNNSWYVNLFNFLHQVNFDKGHSDEPQDSIQLDPFTTYLKQVVFRTSFKIYGFISVTNKMTSNECLSALIFSNYLHNFKLNPIKFQINVPQLTIERKQLQLYIIKEFKENQSELNQAMTHLLSYLNLLDKYMQEINFLEYQYSLVLTAGCEKLKKYIFTEELQDFFYAKKVSVKASEDLIQIYKTTKKTRNQISLLKSKICKCIQGNQKRQQKIGRMLDLLLSLSYHFLYETDNKLQDQLALLVEFKRDECIEKANQVQLMVTREQIKQIKGQQKKKKEEMSKEKKKVKRSKDELDCMFRNKNVELRTKVKKLL